MTPTFWKLSYGTKYFAFSEILESIEERLVYIFKDTEAKGTTSISQGENFINANIGDYFYLTHGNQGIYVLGQFNGPVNFLSSKHKQGWIDRPYRIIAHSKDNSHYEGPEKWWTPNHRLNRPGFLGGSNL